MHFDSNVTLLHVPSSFAGTFSQEANGCMSITNGTVLLLSILLKSRRRNLWPCRYYWTPTLISPGQHCQWSGIMGAKAQQHFEGHRFPTHDFEQLLQRQYSYIPSVWSLCISICFLAYSAGIGMGWRDVAHQKLSAHFKGLQVCRWLKKYYSVIYFSRKSNPEIQFIVLCALQFSCPVAIHFHTWPSLGSVLTEEIVTALSPVHRSY